MLVALDILAWSPNVMTGEWARHPIRILRFQVLYGNIPGVQIPIPHPHHTRRPKLHSRTKFQATEKQQEQPPPLEAKHRAIYCYYVLVACKLKERRARAASQQSMNSDMFPNAIHRRDTSTPRQTLDKDTCRSRRNTIQIETHGHDTCTYDCIILLYFCLSALYMLRFLSLLFLVSCLSCFAPPDLTTGGGVL